jgi:hypothetical protein
MKEAPLDIAYLQDVLALHQLTARFNTWKTMP